MADRIERRPNLAGSRTDAEALETLEERRSLHARVTRGKPEKTFDQLLEEKMKDPEEAPEEVEAQPKGAKDPYLGLSPSQSPELAESGKGRRAGRVILKG